MFITAPLHDTVHISTLHHNHLLTQMMTEEEESHELAQQLFHQADKAVKSRDVFMIQMLYQDARVIHGGEGFGKVSKKKQEEEEAD